MPPWIVAMDIHQALDLIQEWVETVAADDLPEACRVSGNDFFAFLKQRGFNPGVFVVAVEQATGYRPNNLWQVADLNLLRQAISGYHAAEFELSHEEYRDGQSNVQWLRDVTRRYFS